MVNSNPDTRNRKSSRPANENAYRRQEAPSSEKQEQVDPVEPSTRDRGGLRSNVGLLGLLE